ncbi:MAG: FAD-binding protein [Promethearchaeota archaeon]
MIRITFILLLTVLGYVTASPQTVPQTYLDALGSQSLFSEESRAALGAIMRDVHTPDNQAAADAIAEALGNHASVPDRRRVLENDLIPPRNLGNSPFGKQLRKYRKYAMPNRKQKYTKCEKMAHKYSSKIGGTHSNWFETVVTNVPVFYPLGVSGLQRLLKEASKDPECIVRPRGAGHTENGVIVQKRETNAIIVALGELELMESHPEWDNTFVDGEPGKFRINAGESWYKFMSLVRPEGWLMQSQTAGPFFSIGGVVANMAHGSNGFLHDYVTGMLVMTADGNVREIFDETELNFWRSSLGLNGIILSVEFQLVPDEGIVYKNFNQVYDLVGDPSAFGQMIADIYTVEHVSAHAEHFFCPYTGEVGSVYYDFSGTPYDGTNATLRAQYENEYEYLLNAFPNSQFDGAYALPVESACDLIPEPFCLDPQIANYAFSAGSVQSIIAGWQSAGTKQNDGYWIMDGAPNFESIILACPPEFMGHVLGTYLAVFGAFAGNPATTHYPNSVMEWRLVKSTTSAILNPIPTFAEFRAEFLAKNGFVFPNPSGLDGVFMWELTSVRNIFDEHADQFLAAFQNALLATPVDPTQPLVECDLPGGIYPPNCNPAIQVKVVHFGKGYGYGVDPKTTPFTGKLQPFVDEVVNSLVFTTGKETALEDFEVYRRTQDPNRLFFGGALAGFLDPANATNSDYDVRSLDGQVCNSGMYTPIDTECINGCCNSEEGTCYETGLRKRARCEASCQCQDGHICVEQFGNRKRCIPQ